MSAIVRFLRGYGLAITCIAAPFLVTAVLEYTVFRLVPNGGISALEMGYELRARTPSPPALSFPAPGPAGTAKTAEAGKQTAKLPPDPKLEFQARYIAGRYHLAVASGFVALISLFSILFGVTVIFQRAGARILALCLGAGVIVAALASCRLITSKQARPLIFENVLTVADRDGLLKAFTDTAPAAGFTDGIIFLNNFFPVVGAVLLLGALCLLTVRNSKARLTVPALRTRLRTIQTALLLGSSILVVAVVSTKFMLQWPLSLLIEPQREALEALSNALLLRWGALSTLCLIAAFTPALTAWALDVAEVTAKGRGKQNSAGVVDLAMLPKVGAVIAALAPLLASPFIDALKSLVDVIPAR